MVYNYSEDLKVAKEAAEKASEIIRNYSTSESFSVRLKGKNDLVTEADVASEKEIISTIKKAFSCLLYFYCFVGRWCSKSWID